MPIQSSTDLRARVPYTLRSGAAPYLAALVVGAVVFIVMFALHSGPNVSFQSMIRVALPWTLGASLASRTRSVGSAVLASIALACAILLANVLPLIVSDGEIQLERAPFLGFVLVAGAVLGVIASPPIAAAAQARASGALDENDFVVGVSAVWAALIMGTLVSTNCMLLGLVAWAGGLVRRDSNVIAPVVAMLGSVALLGIASARHVRRLAWMARVCAGREAGWRVNARPEALARLDLPPFSTVEAPLDAVLERVAARSDVPFRVGDTVLGVARLHANAARTVSPRMQQLFVIMVPVGVILGALFSMARIAGFSRR